MKEFLTNPKRLSTWVFGLWFFFGVFTGFIYFPVCGPGIGLPAIICFGLVCLIGLVFSLLIRGIAVIGMPGRMVLNVLIILLLIVSVIFLLKHNYPIDPHFRACFQGRLFGSMDHSGGEALYGIVHKVFFSSLILLPNLSLVAILVSGGFKKETSLSK